MTSAQQLPPPSWVAMGQTGNGGTPNVPTLPPAPALPAPPSSPSPPAQYLPTPPAQTWTAPGRTVIGGTVELSNPTPSIQIPLQPSPFSVPDRPIPTPPPLVLSPSAPSPIASPGSSTTGLPQVVVPPGDMPPANLPLANPQPYGQPGNLPPGSNTQPGNMPPGGRTMNPPDASLLLPEQNIRLPGRDEIFGPMKNERQLENWVMEKVRVSQGLKLGDASLKFPDEEIIGFAQDYKPKTTQYPPQRVNYDNLYVVHRRLLFEELNAERYGWDMGILQPLASSLYFYKDVLLLPYSVASGFNQGFWDTSAGKCLPGSPTPYMLYPPGLSITGGTFEGTVVTGLAFIFH
jgi:hypothetical protein